MPGDININDKLHGFEGPRRLGSKYPAEKCLQELGMPRSHRGKQEAFTIYIKSDRPRVHENRASPAVLPSQVIGIPFVRSFNCAVVLIYSE